MISDICGCKRNAHTGHSQVLNVHLECNQCIQTVNLHSYSVRKQAVNVYTTYRTYTRHKCTLPIYICIDFSVRTADVTYAVVSLRRDARRHLQRRRRDLEVSVTAFRIHHRRSAHVPLGVEQVSTRWAAVVRALLITSRVVLTLLLLAQTQSHDWRHVLLQLTSVVITVR